MSAREAPEKGARPRCPGCNDPLRPRMKTTVFYDDGPQGRSRRAESEWMGSYRGYGHFCTLRCCERYANKVFELYGDRFQRVSAPAAGVKR